MDTSTKAKMRDAAAAAQNGFWSKGKQGDSVVSDLSFPDKEAIPGSNEPEYYGGFLVAESVNERNRAHIIESAPTRVLALLQYCETEFNRGRRSLFQVLRDKSGQTGATSGLVAEVHRHVTDYDPAIGDRMYSFAECRKGVLEEAVNRLQKVRTMEGDPVLRAGYESGVKSCIHWLTEASRAQTTAAPNIHETTELWKDNDGASIARNHRADSLFAWAERCFGSDEVTSLTHRGMRFFEEAADSVHAAGMTEEEAHRVVSHVYSKPKGDLDQELGGVGVTLLLFARAAGLSADIEERREMTRIFSLPDEHFTQRNAEKNRSGLRAVAHAMPPIVNSEKFARVEESPSGPALYIGDVKVCSATGTAHNGAYYALRAKINAYLRSAMPATDNRAASNEPVFPRSLPPNLSRLGWKAAMHAVNIIVDESRMTYPMAHAWAAIMADIYGQSFEVDGEIYDPTNPEPLKVDVLLAAATAEAAKPDRCESCDVSEDELPEGDHLLPDGGDHCLLCPKCRALEEEDVDAPIMFSLIFARPMPQAMREWMEAQADPEVAKTVGAAFPIFGLTALARGIEELMRDIQHTARAVDDAERRVGFVKGPDFVVCVEATDDEKWYVSESGMGDLDAISFCRNLDRAWLFVSHASAQAFIDAMPAKVSPQLRVEEAAPSPLAKPVGERIEEVPDFVLRAVLDTQVTTYVSDAGPHGWSLTADKKTAMHFASAFLAEQWAAAKPFFFNVSVEPMYPTAPQTTQL